MMHVHWETAIHEAMHCGFSYAALLPARVLEEYAPDAQDYRVHNTDPWALLSSAQSVLVMAMPFSWFAPWPKGHAEVSAYYMHSNAAYQAKHRLGKRLKALGAAVSTDDSLPLKLLGREAGIGVIGRNCLLRNDAWGSCFALQMLVTDIAPQPEAQRSPMAAAGCGSCTRCVDACPTGALRGNGRLLTDRCIRAQMFSGKVVPEALREPMGTRLIGCEICQRVCPRNAKIPMVSPETEPFQIEPLLRGDRESLAVLADLLGANDARKQRIQAQAAIAAGNARAPARLPALQTLVGHERPAIDEHARWAIDQILKER